ncbi:amidohydrolase family protein [Shimia sagamensis]|uniref:Imidazolonepropionase n=1 Tax=Shimia sagamensis TaxID=1566352 RepID=A0ABY1N6J0_9RHOB|nr:amidohydrolase family protein [Shimia sagamensis]SMP00746.1 Imidazolonepropionase [Shimia sagamensis]
MKHVILSSALAVLATAVAAQDAPTPILFTNVNVWDGESDKLLENANVVVTGNLITEVSSTPLAVANAKIIDGGGRSLMPGLIESHVHVNLQHMLGGYDTIELRDWQEIGAMGAVTAQSLLKDGWTTIRDPGANAVGIKKVVDRGEMAGPRMYQAGGVISQTSGHGDFRLAGQRLLEERYTFKGYRLGFAYIVDGRDATLSAARQNLANGATFLKMMMGGGIFSTKDPLHTKQSSDEEIQAVVEAATQWDTYVTAHIFLPEHARRAIGFGLKEILHIPYLDVETAEFMVEKGVFYNPQLSQSSPDVLEATFGAEESVTKAKARVTQEAMQQTTKVIQQVPELLETMTFGADIVTNTKANALRTRDHEMWFWAENFGILPTLKAMTSNGGKLAALTGKNNPYPDGPLGVIKPGAYADILLIDGNPLEDITLLGASAKMFDAPERTAGDIPAMDLIMKDGVIYKNTLD